MRSIGVQEIAAWSLVKIGAADADTLRLLAVDLELNQARTDARGVWWRRALPMQGGIVVSAGLHRG